MPLGQVAKNLSILDMLLDYCESDILSTKLNLSAECRVQGVEYFKSSALYTLHFALLFRYLYLVILYLVQQCSVADLQ